ncbi:MAG: GMC family oxidoreductase [Pseudanabaenaceae cyanobacterium bins.68]|nr:GMC family oxidoreductase [Pseudanabaenaceae cyanobacterium bins.68]
MRTQVAVIGSGAGGAVVAYTLAAAGLEVLLIEEGANLNLDHCSPFSLAEMTSKYRHGGVSAAFGKPKIQYVEGRCLGGGTEINSGLYHRTPPELLAKWQALYEVEAIALPDLEPHFQFGEQAVSVSYLPGQPPAASLKLKAGAEAMGWECLEVPRWFKYDSHQVGRKQSMTETLIPMAIAQGAVLLTDTWVQSLKYLDQLWQIQARQRSQTLTITAETVFVCGGAIQTPALLQRSGITKNVGRSLQMHPTVKITARFQEEVNDQQMGVAVHQVKEFLPRFNFGCSISSRAYLGLAMNDHPAYAWEVDQFWQRMAIYYAAIGSEATGRGNVLSLPGFRDPLVKYQLDQSGLKVLAEALTKLSELLLAAGAVALYPSITGSDRLTKTSDLANLPQILPSHLTNLITVHLFSSCPMGENRRLCATDSFGKVFDTKNLYISDASLLCTALGVNPQGTIMAIARRNALKFLGKL